MLKKKKKKKTEKPAVKKKSNQAELQYKEYKNYIDRIKTKAKKEMGIEITNIVWHILKK
jgi:hypothetical protein